MPHVRTFATARREKSIRSREDAAPAGRLTAAAFLRNNPWVIPLRAAKALCALAAMFGLAGLSILPPEHVHSQWDDAATHHETLVHRHFVAHHAADAHAGLHTPRAASVLHGTILRSSDGDDDEPLTIHVVFTAEKQASPRPHAPAVHHVNDRLPEPPDARRIEAFLWMPPPAGLFIDPIRPVRAPPVPS
jgi:hypothetical protein